MSFYEWREAIPAEFAVLGDPVGHSLSPRMHSAALRALGRDELYLAVRVPLVEFDDAVAHLANLGYQGLNCTVPLKEAAFRWCGDVDPRAKRIGAVNTIRVCTGEGTNTDCAGILRVVERHRPQWRRALILGAGGTARAVAVALEDGKLTLYNRTRSRADELLSDTNVAATITDQIDLFGFDIVVNCTSVGLHGETLEIDWSRAERELLAIDMVYGNEPTPFVQKAREHGLEAIDGRPMLVAQGAASLEWWLGCTAPLEVMEDAVR